MQVCLTDCVVCSGGESRSTVLQRTSLALCQLYQAAPTASSQDCRSCGQAEARRDAVCSPHQAYLQLRHALDRRRCAGRAYVRIKRLTLRRRLVVRGALLRPVVLLPCRPRRYLGAGRGQGEDLWEADESPEPDLHGGPVVERPAAELGLRFVAVHPVLLRPVLRDIRNKSRVSGSPVPLCHERNHFLRSARSRSS
ncbi:unnamed protein product [Pedinophyceae sp. YPF-701]|nr:unnamed protein product [Pedinophyceae sp. YPF-701]